MNLSIYGFGDGAAPAMADRRLRRVVCRRGASARRRSDPAGHPLSDRGAQKHRRPRAHPRPRGPSRRADRSVAAAQSAALCHAIHRRLVRGQAGRPSPARRRFPSTSCRWAGTLTLGPFTIDFINVAHSIPESNALAIRTPAGTVVHTGDWKIDPTPIIGAPTDEARLTALGDEGVLALVGDSTNAVRDGRSPSEADVAKTLAELIRTAPAPRRGDDVCLPCRPPARGRRCGARRRPRSRAGRPRHGARRAGRARDRLSRRRAGFSQRAKLRLSAARQGFGAVHRQPGRAARGAVAHRRGRAPGGHAVARRPRDLFLARHPRQRKGGWRA